MESVCELRLFKAKMWYLDSGLTSLTLLVTDLFRHLMTFVTRVDPLYNISWIMLEFNLGKDFPRKTSWFNHFLVTQKRFLYIFGVFCNSNGYFYGS